MAYEHVVRKFEAIGGKAVVEKSTDKPAAENDSGYSIDIVRKGRQTETFILQISPASVSTLEVTVPHIDKRRQHLLLAVRSPSNYTQFLCGRDERHWFVAALPKNVGNVQQAIEALKPEQVFESENHRNVARKNRNKRFNAAFIRQGEWFFLPAPEMRGKTDLHISHNYPLQRGNGRPHIAEYYCLAFGSAIYQLEGEEEEYIQRDYPHPPVSAEQASQETLIARLDPRTYVKGAISHPDHKTIVLEEWHYVVANNEASATTGIPVEYVD